MTVAERVSPELAQVAQEFLATEHRRFELFAQTHRIGEVKLLSTAAGRVPWAFRWLFIEVHEQIF